jgi:hypothetical protein
MGLDMYACTTTKNIPAVDFAKPGDTKEIFYWRKHPNLHGWMQKLYEKKGGEDPDFNIAPLRLDASDIDALEKAVEADDLPLTAGFFFGRSRPESRQETLDFIRCARKAIAKGERVFYLAWW